MATITDFPVPAAALLDFPTVCERNSMLINENIIVGDYQRLSVKESGGQRKNLACLATSHKDAFLTADDSYFDTLKNKWSAQGFYGVLSHVCKNQKTSTSLHQAAEIFQKYYNSLVEYGEKKFKNNKIEIMKRKEVLLACHVHIGRIAIVVEGNTIKVVNVLNKEENEHGLLLKDKRVNRITCLAWRPHSSLSLAVGSDCGVLVWFLDPGAVRPGSNSTKLLQRSGVGEVTSLSWCRDGKLLATSYKNSPNIWIWDTLREQYEVIQRVGSPVLTLDWSRCGGKLLSTNHTNLFRVWDCDTWTCEKWSALNGPCTASCWSSCGSILLFTVANEPYIYYVNFYKGENKGSVAGSGVALKCADLTLSQIDGGESVGGLISQMVWDQTASRLAVSFQGEDGVDSPFIALFHTNISPVLQLVPCGFINGEPGEIPKAFDFVRGYTKGALLAVYWSSETLSTIPLLFNQNLNSPTNFYQVNTTANRTFEHTLGADLSGTMHHHDASLFSVM